MPDDSNANDSSYDQTIFAGRGLVAGERADARALFGDAMDYDAVGVFEVDQLGHPRAIMAESEGDVYVHERIYFDDFSRGLPEDRATLIHELTHVWQEENNLLDYERLNIDLAKNGNDYAKVYDYELTPSSDFFKDFNFEQQAEITFDYFMKSIGEEIPGKEDVPLEEYESVLPFDQYGGEQLEEGDWLAETYQEPAVKTIRSDPAPLAGDDAPPPAADGQTAAPSQPAPLLEPAAASDAAPASPSSEPAPAAQPLTPEDIANDRELAADQRDIETNGDAQGADNTRGETPPGYDDRSQEEIGEEMEAALRGEATGSEDDGESEGEPEQQEAGGEEMPNPVNDPNPRNGNYTVLLNRDGPVVNPGSGDFDLPSTGGDLSDLLNRNAPAVNPGSSDFDMPVVGGDVSMLLTRNAPVVNPGLVDFDMPDVGHLSDLFDRNGPRQTAATDSAELAGFTLGSDPALDLGVDLDDLGSFDIL